MRIFKGLQVITLFILPSLLLASPMQITPEFKPVELSEFTSLSISVMPDSGTQLIFPFLLDNPELEPALKIVLTNSGGFAVPTSESELKTVVKQNTITITGLSNPGNPTAIHLGSLFITIGGYNLTIALKTTLNPAEVVTNYVFNIPNDKRDLLVERAVKRYTDEIDKKYRERFERIDIQAREEALKYIGKIAVSEPDSQKISVERNVPIGDDRLLVYMDETLIYPDFNVLKFSLENYTSLDYILNGITITGKKAGSEKQFSGELNCPKKIKSDDKFICTFSTIDKSFSDSDVYRVSISTDRGEGTFEW